VDGINYSGTAELLNIPTDKIELGDRGRQKYTNLQALAEDIKQKGLIHPIAVKRKAEGSDEYLLLAGGRRFSAHILAGIPTIPCRVYSHNISDIDRREIELMENVSREDLLWVEKNRITDELHRLRVEQHGEAFGPSGGHSAADTAKELGVSPATVSRQRKLSAAMQEHGEELSKAKTESEAWNILRKIEDRKANEAYVAKVEADSTWDDNERKTLINGYIVGDFFERVKEVPDHAVELIEIDPPYGIGLTTSKKREYNRSRDAGLQDYNEIPADQYPQFLHDLFAACFRVHSRHGWLLCWCGAQWANLVQDLLRDQDYVPSPVPLYWVRPGGSQTNHPDLYLGSQVETCVYARKGEATIVKQGRGNAFTFPGIPSQNKSHPTERPVELLSEILRVFSRPQQRIMVPFLGSGNTLLAASNVGCSGFGFDLSQDFRNAYVRRVTEGEIRKYKSLP